MYLVNSATIDSAVNSMNVRIRFDNTEIQCDGVYFWLLARYHAAQNVLTLCKISSYIRNSARSVCSGYRCVRWPASCQHLMRSSTPRLLVSFVTGIGFERTESFNMDMKPISDLFCGLLSACLRFCKMM